MIYYINADTGNDTTGLGTAIAPWATISKSQTMASNGDTIILQESTAHYAWAVLTLTKVLTYECPTIGGAIVDALSATTTRFLIQTTGIIFNNIDFTGLALNNSQYGGFKGNIANSNPTFNNCRFYGNALNVANCGIFCSITPYPFTPTFNSCLFYGNTGAGSGYKGAIYTDVNATNSPVFNNCTIHLDGSAGNEFYMFNGYGGTTFTPVLKNTIILNSQAVSVPFASAGAVMTYSCYYGTFTAVPSGAGNINVDPKFIDSAGRNYNLSPSSPCIDTGTLL